MESWTKQLLPIIEEYKDGDLDVKLSLEDVANLCLIIKAKINLQEGNITEEEYHVELDKPNHVFIVVGSDSTLREIQNTTISELNEEDMENFVNGIEGCFEVAKYRTDNIDFGLLGEIEGWGCYNIITQEKYNELINL